MSKVSDEDVPDIKTGLFRNTCSWLAVSPVITRSKCSFPVKFYESQPVG